MPKLFNGVAAQILLVDDNPGDAQLTCEAFSEARVKNDIHHVRDGVEAMAFLRREAPYVDAPRPDLILLDLNMPRMTGYEVLEAIKASAELKTIPVIVLTTSDADYDIERSYALQANCFVSKPVDLEDFLVAVRGIESFWLALVKLPEEPEQHV